MENEQIEQNVVHRETGTHCSRAVSVGCFNPCRSDCPDQKRQAFFNTSIEKIDERAERFLRVNQLQGWNFHSGTSE